MAPNGSIVLSRKQKIVSSLCKHLSLDTVRHHSYSLLFHFFFFLLLDGFSFNQLNNRLCVSILGFQEMGLFEVIFFFFSVVVLFNWRLIISCGNV